MRHQQTTSAIGQAFRKLADGFKKNLSFLALSSVFARCWLGEFTENTASKDRKYTCYRDISMHDVLIKTNYSPLKLKLSWQN